MANSYIDRLAEKVDRYLREAKPVKIRREPGAEPVSTRRRVEMLSWSSSPSLEKILGYLDGQRRALDEAKRFLEDNLTPFQKCLAEQKRAVDQAIRQLENRLRPLKQYLDNQAQNLERVGAHLEAELKDQFDAFGVFLREEQKVLEKAYRYIKEQPKPFQRFLSEQQSVVELIFEDVEGRFEAFLRHLQEQEKLLDALTEPEVSQELQTLSGLLAERHRALEKFSSREEPQAAELFGELEALYEKYRTLEGGRGQLVPRVVEELRRSDEKLKESLRLIPLELREEGKA